MDQFKTVKMLFGSITQELLCQTQILMLFLSSLDNLLYCLKKVSIILRKNTKHVNFWVGVEYNLNKPGFKIPQN